MGGDALLSAPGRQHLNAGLRHAGRDGTRAQLRQAAVQEVAGSRRPPGNRRCGPKARPCIRDDESAGRLETKAISG